jgi:hypothetical protein
MSKKDTGTGFMVRAIQTGFLGSLRFVNDTFTCPDEEAFAPNWMERLEPKEAAKAANTPAPETGLGFTVKHVPAGNWAVVNKDGERFSRVFKKDEGNAKDLAEQEALRLNAGGEPVMPGPTGGGAKPVDTDGDEEQDDTTLPDA